MSDSIHKFMHAAGGVRIEAVQLQSVWQAMNAHRQLPAPVRSMLGELVAASALLAATLKFNGALVLQVQGDGPVRLAVVECAADFGIRAAIKLRDDADTDIKADADFTSLVNAGGQGRFVIVLDPKDKMPGQQAYTGIVPIVGEQLADCLDNYFASSEQLPTQLVLAADDSTAAGMLVQKMPLEGGRQASDTDAWNRAQHLFATVKPDELLNLAPQELVRRVFWEETLSVAAPRPVAFRCSCSREKVADVIRMLGAAEIESVIAERGAVTINCEYCDTEYVFDPVDCAQALLNAPAAAQAPADPSQLH
jgi:molecular chaperone Hsp33